ncbi:MAG TPA: hypothetical protein VI381_04080 [Allosphingosinicella sp.]
MTDQPSAKLASSFSRTFSAFLSVQARALVVECQPTAARNDTGLLHGAARAQVAFQEQATYFLSGLAPAAITNLLGPASRVVNLMKSAEALLPAPGVTQLRKEDAVALAGQLRALGNVVQGAAGKSKTFVAEQEAWAAAVDKAGEKLGKLTKEIVKQSAEGEAITAIEDKIAKKREEIDADIDDILTKSRNIGDKAGELITDALTYILPDGKKKKPEKEKPADGDDEPDEGKGDDKDDDVDADDEADADESADPDENADDDGDADDGDGDAKKKRDKARKSGGKAVQALKATGDLSGDVGTAAARLRRHNRELGDLYYDLAALRGDVAWARAIGDQGRSLRRAAAAMTETLADITAQWEAIAADIAEQASALEKSRNGAALRTSWSGTREGWSDLGTRLQRIEAALSGNSRLIGL